MTGNSRRINKPQVSQEEEGIRQRRAYGMSTDTSGHDGEAPGATRSKIPVGQTDYEDQVGSSTWSQAQKVSPSNSVNSDSRTLGGGARPTSLEIPPMIGDFDDNANALWSLHMKEAKGHDEARIQSLKDNMDGVLLFAGLFSVTLASFITDKIHDLQVDPAQQMVYYQQQNVALLAQISHQVSSIAPRVSIPSTPPPPYPDFIPNPSDVRVNAFWVMSLVFSLSAVFLATLVRQWVREYMHVFQRYTDPLKSARLRQYLYEGAEGWYMPIVAECVPGLFHVSLFLFFLGLGDWLLALNTTIGNTTIIPITICGLVYILSTFAPIFNPQSPLRNPFSGLIWYLTQKVHPRRYFDWASSGGLKIVSSNMSEGQVQLAMEENDERKDRDVRAIRWLIDNRTEDDKTESFVMAIPGAFMSKWGIEVWRKVSEEKQYEDVNSRPNDFTVQSQTDPDLRGSVLSPHDSPFGIPRDVAVTRSIPHATNDPLAARNLAMQDLCRRVRHLLDTCGNRSLVANKELWRKRARGCVETAASLVFCANIKLELFGDLGRLLRELGESENIRDLSAAGSDGSFVVHWTCLSLLVITRKLANDSIEMFARNASIHLSYFSMEDDGEEESDDDPGKNALSNARRIDNYFETARSFCMFRLRNAFGHWEEETTEEQVRDVLARDYEADISTLERITPAVDQMASIDIWTSGVNDVIRSVAADLMEHLPGVAFDEFELKELIQPIRFLNLPVAEGQAFTPQLIFLRQRLRFLCSYAPKLRDIISGRGDGIYQETLKSLEVLWEDGNRGRSIVYREHLMERQLWRLLDLRDSGGFGFSIELFFIVLAQLFSKAPSRDAHSAVIIGTFRAITSNWRQHKHSIATQRVILNLICDIAIHGCGIVSSPDYPKFITDELLVLLGNILEGQSGSHIYDAITEMYSLPEEHPSELFVAEVIKVISPHALSPYDGWYN